MDHSYCSIFNKHSPLVLSHWKFATDNPLPLVSEFIICNPTLTLDLDCFLLNTPRICSL